MADVVDPPLSLQATAASTIATTRVQCEIRTMGTFGKSLLTEA